MQWHSGVTQEKDQLLSFKRVLKQPSNMGSQSLCCDTLGCHGMPQPVLPGAIILDLTKCHKFWAPLPWILCDVVRRVDAAVGAL